MLKVIALAEAELLKEGAERLYLDGVEATSARIGRRLSISYGSSGDYFVACRRAGRAGQSASAEELADLYAAGLSHLRFPPVTAWLEALKALRQVRATDRSYKM